jgi:hypothetical protein
MRGDIHTFCNIDLFPKELLVLAIMEGNLHSDGQ